jgi:6-phosphogluconolactonase (cycloisomerase 2 family)
VDIITAAIDNSDPLLGYKTLAVASYGDANIYIYDISAAGTTATYVKKIDATAQLSGTFFQGLAFDLNGNLYGMEASSDTLYVYNVSTGTYTGTTLTVTGLSAAGTLALDIDTTDNSIHQSNYGSGSIKNFTGA